MYNGSRAINRIRIKYRFPFPRMDDIIINRINIKYRFPFPRMDDMIYCLSGENYFTKIDLKSGYHHIRIKEGDEWKIASRKKMVCISGWLCPLVWPMHLVLSWGSWMRFLKYSWVILWLFIWMIFWYSIRLRNNILSMLDKYCRDWRRRSYWLNWRSVLLCKRRLCIWDLWFQLMDWRLMTRKQDTE